MYMKKIPVMGMMGILLAASFVTPVSAHGHHHNQTNVAAASVCEVCTLEGCEQTGLHTHDDETYCGYSHKSGYCDGSCGAVAVCTVEGCDQTGYHAHDKATYCGYAHDCGYCDGSCGAAAVCTVEGCNETGRHVHDETAYCGYAHSGGYCDGSCVQAVCPNNGGHRGCHGHHGRR